MACSFRCKELPSRVSNTKDCMQFYSVLELNKHKFRRFTIIILLVVIRKHWLSETYWFFSAFR
jgi:hypothetical protein